MKFSEQLWEAALPVYKKIIAHPFNQELKNGTLPVEKFKFYIYQDSLYLADFAKALATAGTRSGDGQDMLDFLQFSQNAILVERALHNGFFQEYGIRLSSGKAPGCFAYTNYLLAVSAFRPFEVAVAALLPCFWIYKKVGDYIYANQSGSNPFQNWIDTYAGEEFGVSVQKALEICDRLAAGASEQLRQEMMEAYVTATRLEYSFWDSAYRLEEWSC